MYVPLNAPIEALGTMNQTFAFGEVKSGEEAIAPSFECEGAGDGDGDQNRDDSSVGGTTSGGGIHSIQVNAALLAGDSQHMCQSQRTRNGNLPVSSGPPTSPAECLYGGVRPQHQHGRIKLKSIKVSQMHKVEMTYQGCTGIAQPPINGPKHAYRVVGPSHRCRRIKIEPTNVSPT